MTFIYIYRLWKSTMFWEIQAKLEAISKYHYYLLTALLFFPAC